MYIYRYELYTKKSVSFWLTGLYIINRSEMKLVIDKYYNSTLITKGWVPDRPVVILRVIYKITIL